MSDEPTLQAPSVQVTRGNPDDVELAAVVAVVAASTRAAPTPRAEVDSKVAAGWKSYWRTVRREMRVGREAWRNTYR